MPAAAHAVPLGPGPSERRRSPVWPGEALLHAFLSASVDALVRESVALHVQPPPRDRPGQPGARANRSKWLSSQADTSLPWELRFVYALVSEKGAIAFARPEEQGLPDALEAWAAPAFGAKADKASAREEVGG